MSEAAGAAVGGEGQGAGAGSGAAAANLNGAGAGVGEGQGVNAGGGEGISVNAAGGEGSTSKWSESLSPELKEYVTNKGFKDPTSVLESYRNLEKLRGVPQDRLLKLPESPDAPEWKDVYAKLGTPATPNDYGLEPSEGGDEGFLNWAKETFHGLNLTKNQAHALVEKFGEYAVQKTESQNADYGEKIKAQELELKKEWGSAYHQNIAQAQAAARAFDIPGEAVDALEKSIGFDGTMKFLSNIGKKMGEAAFHGGNQRQGFGEAGEILSPSQAKAKIAALKADSTFTEKYLAGDGAARERLSRLHKMAYPDD